MKNIEIPRGPNAFNLSRKKFAAFTVAKAIFLVSILCASVQAQSVITSTQTIDPSQIIRGTGTLSSAAAFHPGPPTALRPPKPTRTALPTVMSKSPRADANTSLRYWNRFASASAPKPADLSFTPTDQTSFDLAGAISGNQVLTATNAGIAVHSTAGSELLSLRNQHSFFSPLLSGSDFVFDPKAYFDATYGRFVVVYVVSDASQNPWINGALLIAVSASSDALGAWSLYRIPLHDGFSRWADYPEIGVTDNAVWFSAILLGPAPFKNFLYVEKSALFSGLNAPIPRLVFEPFASGPPFNLWLTESSVGSGNELILSGMDDGVELSKIARTSEGLTLTRSIAVIRPPYWPDGALVTFQPGYSNAVLCGGASPVASSFFGKLDLAIVGRAPLSDGTRIEVLQVFRLNQQLEVESLTILDGRFERKSYMCPSITKNHRGDTLLGFSTSGPLSYISSAYSVRRELGPGSQFSAPVVVREGVGPCIGNRFGDYSSAALGVNQLDFWSLQFYCGPFGEARMNWARLGEPWTGFSDGFE